MPLQPIKIKIKKLHPDAKTPTISTPDAAGFDLYSIEDKILSPNETYPIKTGIIIEIPEGKVLHIWDRSGMGMKGCDRIAQGIIIDYYTPEFKVVEELSDSQRGQNWNSSTGR